MLVFCLQFMHIPDRDRCNWLRERIETPEQARLQFSLRSALHMVLPSMAFTCPGFVTFCTC